MGRANRRNQSLHNHDKKEIYKSWSKAKTKNVQNDYPQEMAKRTVLSRAAKMFINSSSDNDLLVKAINETTEDEYDNNQPRKRYYT